MELELSRIVLCDEMPPAFTRFLGEGYFFGEFFPVFLGIFSRFLVEGRCEEGRKEGMGEGSKKQIGIKKNK